MQIYQSSPISCQLHRTSFVSLSTVVPSKMDIIIKIIHWINYSHLQQASTVWLVDFRSMRASNMPSEGGRGQLAVIRSTFHLPMINTEVPRIVSVLKPTQPIEPLLHLYLVPAEPLWCSLIFYGKDQVYRMLHCLASEIEPKYSRQWLINSYTWQSFARRETDFDTLTINQ